MLSFTDPQDGTSTIWEYLKGDLLRIGSVCAFISSPICYTISQKVPSISKRRYMIRTAALRLSNNITDIANGVKRS